ncbi:MAG: hypothetical protein LC723_11340 [Actinobacteria bacterium]|nr:hypothetical protein [Actinomycetota bacterium]
MSKGKLVAVARVFVLLSCMVAVTGCAKSQTSPSPSVSLLPLGNNVIEQGGLEIPLEPVWATKPCSDPKTVEYIRPIGAPDESGVLPSVSPSADAQATLIVQVDSEGTEPILSCGPKGEAASTLQPTRTEMYGGIEFMLVQYTMGEAAGSSWYDSFHRLRLDLRCATKDDCSIVTHEVKRAMSRIGRWTGCWALPLQVSKAVEASLRPGVELIKQRMTIPPMAAVFVAAELKDGTVATWQFAADGRLNALDEVSQRISRAKRPNPLTISALTRKAADRAKACLQTEDQPRIFGTEDELF